MEDFGIIIACYNRDYSFAKACCASIRYFLRDVPICLIVDGIFSLKELEDAYGVRVINRLNVVDDRLREKSFGLGLTKMIAFWESPWKNFLYLDADIIVWGNLLQYANFNDFDLIIDRPCYEYSEETIRQWFFDGKQLEKYYPNFNWRSRHYACSGVFFGKRGLFSLDEYLELLELQATEPNLFFIGEQGILNFMIFRAADSGKIRLGSEDIQLLVPDFSQEELQKRFPVEKKGPRWEDSAPTVIHWSGQKPYMFRSQMYVEPMNFFRRKFLQDKKGITGAMAEAILQVEDFNAYKAKLLGKLMKPVKKLWVNG